MVLSTTADQAATPNVLLCWIIYSLPWQIQQDWNKRQMGNRTTIWKKLQEHRKNNCRAILELFELFVKMQSLFIVQGYCSEFVIKLWSSRGVSAHQWFKYCLFKCLFYIRHNFKKYSYSFFIFSSNYYREAIMESSLISFFLSASTEGRLGMWYKTTVSRCGNAISSSHYTDAIDICSAGVACFHSDVKWVW